MKTLAGRIMLVLSVLASLTGECFSATLDAPDEVAVCSGKLIRCTAEPSSPTSQLIWLVFPTTVPVDWVTVADGVVIAAPAEPTSINLAVIEIGEGVAIPTQHTIRVMVPPVDPPGTEPDEPTDPVPTPGVIDRSAMEEAIRSAYALVTKPHDELAAQVAANARAVQVALERGEYADRKEADRDLAMRNRQTLLVGAIRDAWQPFFRAVQTEATRQRVSTMEDIEVVFDVLADVLEDAAPRMVRSGRVMKKVCLQNGTCVWVPVE